MRGNRSFDTKPEQVVRSLLHRAGYRFRKHRVIAVGGVKVRPDLVFPREHIAVFVDGCFWHGCTVHGNRPRANRTYWNSKLKRNVERDEYVNQVLMLAGWRVLRYWEHEDPLATAECIIAEVKKRRDNS